MCEYCNKDSELYKDECNSHSVLLTIEKFPNNKTKLGIDLYCESEETVFLDYIDINYCPMCGRKLNRNICADEMLKSLNFIKDIDEDFGVIRYKHKTEDWYIRFYPDEKAFDCNKIINNEIYPLEIDIKLLKAINKKIEELE